MCGAVHQLQRPKAPPHPQHGSQLLLSAGWPLPQLWDRHNHQLLLQIWWGPARTAERFLHCYIQSQAVWCNRGRFTCAALYTLKVWIRCWVEKMTTYQSLKILSSKAVYPQLLLLSCKLAINRKPQLFFVKDMQLCKFEAEHFSFIFHKIKTLLHISEAAAPAPLSKISAVHLILLNHLQQAPCCLT